MKYRDYIRLPDDKRLKAMFSDPHLMDDPSWEGKTDVDMYRDLMRKESHEGLYAVGCVVLAAVLLWMLFG